MVGAGRYRCGMRDLLRSLPVFAGVMGNADAVPDPHPPLALTALPCCPQPPS
jgi:hypothetical protein